MKSKIITLLAVVCICNGIYAQKTPRFIKTKQEKGYFNILELGHFIGNSIITSQYYNSTSSLNVTSLRTVNGIFLNPKFSLGIGVGADGNGTGNHGFFNTFIVYADARYYLKNSKNGWFFYTDLGRAVEIDDGFEKGLFLNAGGGFKFNIGNCMLIPSIGYNQQNFQRSSMYNYRNSSLAFKLGFLF